MGFWDLFKQKDEEAERFIQLERLRQEERQKREQEAKQQSNKDNEALQSNNPILQEASEVARSGDEPTTNTLMATLDNNLSNPSECNTNQKKAYPIISLRVDPDILDWLKLQENQSGYIKELIRKDRQIKQENSAREKLTPTAT